MPRNLQAVIVLFLIFVALPASGREQRVLIPAPMSETFGAHGSIWRGELRAYNPGPTTAFIQTAWSLCGIVCPPGRFVLEPGQSVSVPLDLPSMVVITPTPFVGTTRVHWNARIFDVSRLSTDWGTEIPIVHESSMTGDAISLLNVPVTPNFRQTLRIYDSSRRESQARVLAWSEAGTLLAERIVPLRVAGDLELFPGTAFDVAYYEAGLLSLFPELAAIERARLEIVPVETGSRLWGFVSVTHNETQRVTLITPQPTGLQFGE